MEGFMGVDKDGAPIMAPTIKPMVMPEGAALTVHEILEAVTPEPPGPTVPAGRTAKHPAGPGGLVQNEFESNPVDLQRSVATFRLPNPGKGKIPPPLTAGSCFNIAKSKLSQTGLF